MMDLDSYRQAIAQKSARFQPRGFDQVPELPACLKPHQAKATAFALQAGTSATFLDTGLGKSLVGFAWGEAVARRENRPVLMLAPLAVARQHEREAERFGFAVRAARTPEALPRDADVVVTNYERLGQFAPLVEEGRFSGVVLDESSILKSFTGKTNRALNQAFARTPWRLAMTATPAPNDHMEIGQHAAFLGVMRSAEMLSRWFINDSRNAGRYRLKGHAVSAFWSWVASWSRMAALPSDLTGDEADDQGYVLPPLDVRHHTVAARLEEDAGDSLFRVPEMSATSIHKERRRTLAARCDRTAEIVAGEPDEVWIVWVETDAEEEAMTARLPGAMAVRGSMKASEKERRLDAFSIGEARIIVTKSRIAGWGLNWQHCARQAFPGLSYSYEGFYQALRRSWRFGQERAVEAHVVGADSERAVAAAIARKSGDHQAMQAAMREAMRHAATTGTAVAPYRPQAALTLPGWMNGGA